MKKCLALLLVLVLTFSLVACGAKETPTPDATPEKETSTSVEGDSSMDDLPEVTWRLSINTASTMPASIDTEAMAERVKERTNGKFVLEVYPDNLLGAYEAVFEEVMMGSIEMSVNALPTTYDNRLEIFQIPYLISSYDDARVLFTPGNKVYDKIDEILADNNIKNLGIYGDGFVGIGVMELDPNYADPTAKKSQLIRTSSSTSNRILVDALGYQTVTISFSEVFTAMQTGVCDGVFGSSIVSNYNNFREIIKYFINYRGIMDKKAFIVNMDAWNALPEEYQTILQEEVSVICEGSYDNLIAQEEEYAAKLAECGVEFIDFTDEEMAIIAEDVRNETWGVMEETCGSEIIELARSAVEELR